LSLNSNHTGMGSRGGQLFHSHKLLKWSTFILTLTLFVL